MYDLLNLQIAEAASTTRRPVFEVAEMTDKHLILIDLRLPEHGSIKQYPDYVVSLLSQLRILASRKIYYNGTGDNLCELIHDNRKFLRARQRGENKSIETRMLELMREYSGIILLPNKKSTGKKSFKKFSTFNHASEKEICDYLNGNILAKMKDYGVKFTVYAYSSTLIYLYDDYVDRTMSLTDAAELAIKALHKSGFLENRRVFYRDSFARINELKHQNGVLLKVIHAQ
jgi:hypothetical protein